MNKNLILIALFSFSSIYSQDTVAEPETTGSDYNRWTVEANFGQSKGIRPYTTGYSSSEQGRILGTIRLNSYSLGGRYMFTPKFGAKADIAFDNLKNSSSSRTFNLKQYRFNLQGVINGSRMLGTEESFRRFGFLFHGGLTLAMVAPKSDNKFDLINGINVATNNGAKEYNGGLIIGVSPQFRILDRLAISGDISAIANFRQHLAWDGHFSQETNNLAGQMLNATLGLTYSLGKNDVHGDWALIEDKKLEEITELDNRINDLETLMNDTDKDGVPDYLDVENNSIAGVGVDTKGRMIDTNKNGVPDELEKLVTMTTSKDGVDGISNSTANAVNQQMISKLINEGYVTAYFDYDKTEPSEASTEGIDFMLTYLRNNPESTIEIFGNADEIGNTDYNNKLADNRAANVKKMLIDAGIKASRLDVISRGEDKSVNPNSALARRLVRKVSFKIKK